MQAALRRLIRSSLLLPVLPLSFKLWVGMLRLLRILPTLHKSGVRSYKRILVIGLTKHVGDVVMMLPLIEALQAADVDTEIEVAVEPAMAGFLRSMPCITRVHAIECGAASLPILHFYRRIWRILRYYQTSMSAVRYDICLLPRWGVDPTASAYLAYLSGAPQRIGQDPREEAGADNIVAGSACLVTRQIKGGQGLPESLRQLRLLTETGIIFPVDFIAAEHKPIGLLDSVAESVNVEALCFKLGWDSKRKYAVLAPGASHPSRQWPVERFVEAALALHAKYDVGFLAIGSKDETRFGEEMAKAAPGIIYSAVGKTNLFESTSLMSRASLFIGNDSGPGHIAAGLGVPSIIVSSCPASSTVEGPNSPSRVRPVGPHVRVIQPADSERACQHRCQAKTPHCIARVDTKEVVEYASKMIVDVSKCVRH